MRNKPRIRFKGFTEDWEQRELVELCNVYDGTHQTPRYTTSGVMFVSVENIETLESDKYISEDDFNNEFKIFPEFGDVLLTRIGDVGSANIILDNIKRAYYVSLALLKPKDINSLFLLALLSSASVQSEIWKRTLHIAFPKKINKNEINKVIVNKPSNLEQKKIGELIYVLNQIITLHQRKLEKLKLAKKALLQKLFPKNGSQFPEIRFKGFTDAWEQCKFCDVMRFINGRAYKQDELLGAGKYKVLRVGNFYTNDSWYYSNLELDDKYYAMNGDLLYTWSATFGPHIWKGEKVIYHYHIWKIVLQNNIDKLFALQLLEVDKANIMSDKNGSTMVHITKQGMEKKQTIIPMNLNEQKQIAKFLSSMDKVITLHQCKLDKLQDVKKGLLQKMFV
jgi:type I restriction enzyme specificity protein